MELLCIDTEPRWGRLRRLLDRPRKSALDTHGRGVSNNRTDSIPSRDTAASLTTARGNERLAGARSIRAWKFSGRARLPESALPPRTGRRINVAWSASSKNWGKVGLQRPVSRADGGAYSRSQNAGIVASSLLHFTPRCSDLREPRPQGGGCHCWLNGERL